MKKIIFGISVAGLLFSGYLGGSKLITGTCAFNESCPIFLGYPACYFGFIMYLLITIYAGLLLWGKGESWSPLNAILGVSSLGILFAGYFTLGELPVLFQQGLGAYVLGLPTCALGFVMYIALVVLTVRVKKQIEK